MKSLKSLIDTNVLINMGINLYSKITSNIIVKSWKHGCITRRQRRRENVPADP